MSRLLLLALAALPLVACTPTTANDDDDDSSADDDDDTEYVQPAPWADMDFEQRRDYMEYVVFPEVEEMFAEFDSEEYGEISCALCHGADARDVDYELPNGVEALSISDFPFSGSDDPRVAAYGEFMEQTVVPRMAELLETVPFSAENPDGLGCFACHERE